ncbi:MAG: ORF6N domain-containing protein, partial [Paludibacteraceae bacterium]|nr:ORF6N domain-containing protein [Paludibacteraceae bacterium]
VKFNAVKNRIITLRYEKVIIDFDVAQMYGVEAKRINEAVKKQSG